MLVATFDMGTRNFAFCVERRTKTIPKFKPTFDIEGHPTEESKVHLEEIYKNGSLIECQRIDLIEYGQQHHLNNIYLSLTSILDSFGQLWDNVQVILIEQQMAYGRNKANIQALRLAQHCLSYFYTIYGSFKIILEWPSTLKTRLLGCPRDKRNTHRDRKQFSIQLAEKILKDRKDPLLEIFQSLTKKDDVADCILMAQTYGINPKK